MTSFDINNDGLLDVNEQLYRSVGRIGNIIERLNEVLRNQGEALKGNASEIWADLQRDWTAAYADMQSKLNVTTLASINVHEIFKEGDLQSTRVMLQ